MVLILALLLTTVVTGFQRRAVIDTMVVRNSDRVAQAEALARGGIQIAKGLLLKDGAEGEGEDAEAPPGATHLGLLARLGSYELTTPEGGSLKIRIEDAGSKFNLNALVPQGGTIEESAADDEAEEFLYEFFKKAIDEIPLPPGEKFYDDPRELAQYLLDYMDANEDSSLGGFEADWYQQQNPPRSPANGPLMSVEELALVRGFDSNLVEAIRPYVTVYPLGKRSGINLNTAPPHVLSLVFHGTSSDMRLADQDIVQRIMDERAEGRIVCTDSGAHKDCVGLADVDMFEGAIYPPAQLPMNASVFTVTAEASVEGVSRTIEVVIDRVGDGEEPQLLSWRVH